MNQRWNARVTYKATPASVTHTLKTERFRAKPEVNSDYDMVRVAYEMNIEDWTLRLKTVITPIFQVFANTENDARSIVADMYYGIEVQNVQVWKTTP